MDENDKKSLWRSELLIAAPIALLGVAGWLGGSLAGLSALIITGIGAALAAVFSREKKVQDFTSAFFGEGGKGKPGGPGQQHETETPAPAPVAPPNLQENSQNNPPPERPTTAGKVLAGIETAFGLSTAAGVVVGTGRGLQNRAITKTVKAATKITPPEAQTALREGTNALKNGTRGQRKLLRTTPEKLATTANAFRAQTGTPQTAGEFFEQHLGSGNSSVAAPQSPVTTPGPRPVQRLPLPTADPSNIGPNDIYPFADEPSAATSQAASTRNSWGKSVAGWWKNLSEKLKNLRKATAPATPKADTLANVPWDNLTSAQADARARALLEEYSVPSSDDITSVRGASKSESSTQRAPKAAEAAPAEVRSVTEQPSTTQPRVQEPRGARIPGGGRVKTFTETAGKGLYVLNIGGGTARVINGKDSADRVLGAGQLGVGLWGFFRSTSKSVPYLNAVVVAGEGAYENYKERENIYNEALQRTGSKKKAEEELSEQSGQAFRVATSHTILTFVTAGMAGDAVREMVNTREGGVWETVKVGLKASTPAQLFSELKGYAHDLQTTAASNQDLTVSRPTTAFLDSHMFKPVPGEYTRLDLAVPILQELGLIDVNKPGWDKPEYLKVALTAGAERLQRTYVARQQQVDFREHSLVVQFTGTKTDRHDRETHIEKELVLGLRDAQQHGVDIHNPNKAQLEKACGALSIDWKEYADLTPTHVVQRKENALVQYATVGKRGDYKMAMPISLKDALRSDALDQRVVTLLGALEDIDPQGRFGITQARPFKGYQTRWQEHEQFAQTNPEEAQMLNKVAFDLRKSLMDWGNPSGNKDVPLQKVQETVLRYQMQKLDEIATRTKENGPEWQAYVARLNTLAQNEGQIGKLLFIGASGSEIKEQLAAQMKVQIARREKIARKWEAAHQESRSVVPLPTPVSSTKLVNLSQPSH